MSRIIKNISILAVLLAVHFSVINYLLPYYWGSKSTVSKYTLNPKKIEKANVLFFGSSRTLYHVNAKLFSKKTKTSAYNLGIQNGRTLEMSYQIKNFVKNNPTTNEKKYIIYELSPFEDLSAKKVMHTNRIRHFWGFGTLYKSIKNNLVLADYSEIGRSMVNFLESSFKVDLIKEYYLMEQYKKKLRYEKVYGIDAMLRCNGCFVNPNIVTLDKTDKTRKRVKNKEKTTINYYQEIDKISEKDVVLKDLLLQEVANLSELVKANGYELIIINQTGSQQAQIAALKDLETMGYTCLDLGSPLKYPEFYEPGNWFDIAHFTKNGARKFTIELANEFNKLELIERK